MIVLPISKTEIRAMHGSAAALGVLAILSDEPGMSFSLDYLGTATGYDSRPALVKAIRLLALLGLVTFEEPRTNALRDIRLTAAVQLALPAPHTLLAGPAGQLTGERQTVEAGTGQHKARENFSREIFSPVVVVGVNKESISGGIQQQQQTEQKKYHDGWRVRGLLKAISMWPNVAAGLEDADLADVLGWIAYVSDPDQQIRRPAVIVARSLEAGRQPPAPYRPFPICQACRRIEGACDCGGELYWPAEYDQLALQAPAPSWGQSAAEWLARRWFCPDCQAFPCQCPEISE